MDLHQDQDCHLVDTTSNNVNVAANDVEIPMLRSTIDAQLVSTSRRSEDVDELTTRPASD